MANAIDDLFAGMAAAPVFGRGNYMGPGNYVVEIVKIFTKKTFKGAEVLVCEFKVLESNNPEHAVGSSGSWVPKFAQPNTFGNIKELMFAIGGRVGKDVPASATEDHAFATALVRAVCGSDTAKAELKALDIDAEETVIGAHVALECVQIKTQKGADFTRYAWAPVAS